MSPHHFTRDDRLKLEAYKDSGLSNSQIAKLLGFNKSSIGRELLRNSIFGHYKAQVAQGLAVRRRQELERSHKLDYVPLRRYVIDKTMDCWSPEQISGRLRMEYADVPQMRVSYETIYLSAYANDRLGSLLIPYWRQGRKKRKKRDSLKKRREVITGRVPIEQRPEIVTNRSRLGDLEGDTVVGAGQSGNIITLVDRKSLYLFAGLCATRHSKPVAKTTINLLRQMKSFRFHTITFDNGSEFAAHDLIAKELDVKVFFARPYCSNDRARNEHTNGLLRQYFPKGTRFDKITAEQMQRVVDEINNRPRKTLNYRTPAEVFNQEGVAFRI